MTFSFISVQEKEQIAEKIITMEKAALERWTHGDPSGYIEIYSKDVVYFDPSLEKRIDGLEILSEYYEQARGKVYAERFELVNPVVQTDGKMAVLTFNYQSFNGEIISKWNCTEVYRLEDDGNWKICQSHWSLTQPFKSE